MSVLRLTPEQLRAYNAKRGGWAPATTTSPAPPKARQGAKSDAGRPFPASGVRPPSKYGNKRTTGGYASVKEGKRAAELKLRLAAGEIRELCEQVPFLLIPVQYEDGPVVTVRGKKPASAKMLERECRYIADFCYDAWALGGWYPVVEDVKGVRTKDYIIKRKLMLWVHGIRVREL